MTELEDEFQRAMLATYDKAKELGYNATYFLRMVEEHGALTAAKRLLAKEEIQEGLMHLWELKHLDISMEALVIQERFKPLFTDAEVKEAHRRLEKLGYYRARR